MRLRTSRVCWCCWAVAAPRAHSARCVRIRWHWCGHGCNRQRWWPVIMPLAPIQIYRWSALFGTSCWRKVWSVCIAASHPISSKCYRLFPLATWCTNTRAMRSASICLDATLISVLALLICLFVFRCISFRGSEWVKHCSFYDYYLVVVVITIAIIKMNMIHTGRQYWVHCLVHKPVQIVNVLNSKNKFTD